MQKQVASTSLQIVVRQDSFLSRAEVQILSHERNLRMAKNNRNSGKAWTPSDTKQLRELATENTPTRVIGLKLGRTPDSIYNHASQNDISLKPTNQAPYNRTK